MKKRIVLLVLLAVIAAAPAFSFGIGGAFGIDLAGGTVGPGALLSFKLDEFPAVFGVGARLGEGNFRIGVTADWWLYTTNLVNMLNLYVGPGLFLNVGTGVFDVGGRIPVGINMYVIDPLELFLEVAPVIGIEFSPVVDFPAWGVQGALGFRFWFN